MTTSCIIGIDPGVTGALAGFLGGKLTAIHDMPCDVVVKRRKGAGIRNLIGGSKVLNRRVVNTQELMRILRELIQTTDTVVYCEKITPGYSKGRYSNAVLLEIVGQLRGLVAALGAEFVEVAPEIWKRATGTPTVKAGACLRAQMQFPEWKDKFLRRSMDDGRAEAAMIGWYGVHHGR